MSDSQQQPSSDKKEKKLHPFEKMVRELAPKLAEVSARQLDPDRLARLVLNAGLKNPLLFKCELKSVALCLMTAATLGIEPNTPSGHCYLVPHKNGKLSAEHRRDIYEAQFIMGYKGLIYLAADSGVVTSVTCHAVYEGEPYDITAGTPHDTIVHKPTRDAVHDDKEFGKLIPCVYAILHVPTGPPVVQWMYHEQIERIRKRDRNRMGSWQTDWAQMAKKTVIKRAMNLIPMGPRLALAVEADGRFATGADMADLIQIPADLSSHLELDLSDPPEAATGGDTGERMKEGINAARAKNDDAPPTRHVDDPGPQG